MTPKQQQSAKKASRRKSGKQQPTQKTPQQRVKILGADGKIRFDWRDWA